MDLTLAKESCLHCPIRHRAVCAEADRSELERLEAAKSYRTFPRGTMLAEAGEPLDHLSSIVAGCATMSRTFADGRRQMVGLLLPSDFIGRPGRPTSAYNIEAASEVTLCRFERRMFEELVTSAPNIAHRMLVMTLDELDAARDWAVVLGRMTAREKVVNFLVNLARREAAAHDGSVSGGAVALHLPLSRETIADYLGLTIETTSRQFSALRKDGLIATPSARDVQIPDFEALALEIDDDDGGVIS
ncbi:transcriptional regulator FnrL [Roseivivax sediminis]|uniref:Transcriptional regulator, Crp/Fnr family n=1 Tax=Roseivivax sediminis TaxID=936889 RepID=A0A1I1YTN3_9RHOB|nr:Crp/Fnr family transcriptional regulator [Roseivivax sediminis]SFE22348.1 transcriptional regulator, Crp/Fnr family [Roseivivax sediminis]